ncbi:MAG: PTS fructose transporter subunit IIC [Negativicutes bacterium]
MKKTLSELRKHLMFGLAATIPLITTGCVLIALSLLSATSHQFNSGLLNEISNLVAKLAANTFTMTSSVLSAAIAYSIAGRNGIIPGLVTGLLADAISTDNSGIDVNFIGGIITGFISGYIAHHLDKRTFKSKLLSIKNVVLIPLLTVIATGFIMFFLIGDPTSYFVSWISQSFTIATPFVKILVAVIMGGLIAYDAGGPISKFVFLTVAILVIQFKVYAAMGPVAVALSIPPLAVGITSLIRPTLFCFQPKRTAMAAIFTGVLGLTEGTIPFLALNPLRVIFAAVIGSAVGAGIAAWLNLTVSAPFGGILMLPFMNNIQNYLIAVAIGLLISITLLIAGDKR